MNRRNFLRRAGACGLSGVAGLMALADVADGASSRFRVVARGRGALPSIQPSNAFSGAEKSGFTGFGGVPSYVARSTAQPTMHWLIPSGQRLFQDMVVGVDAEALGGVAYVDFYLEGGTTRVTRTIYNEFNPRTGGTSKLEGFFVNVKWSSALAIIGGTARMFAKATPLDGTMQAKVIGHVAAETTMDAGDYEQPFRLYPHTVQFDQVYRVAASGGTHTTYDAALQAGRHALSLDANTTFSIELTGGTVTPPYPSAGDGWTGNGRGFHRVWASAATTINYATSFDPFNTAGGGFLQEPWSWVISVAGLEFYGGNLTLEFRYWNKIISASNTKPLWFNGCYMTNASGRDAIEWNKAPHPAITMVDTNGNIVPSHFTYSHSDAVDCMNTAVLIKNAVRLNANTDTLQLNTRCAVGLYSKNVDCRAFTNQLNSIQVQYTIAGTATLTKDHNTHVLTLTINGTPDSITLSGNPADTYFAPSAVVTWLSSHANVTATLLDNTRASYALGGVEDDISLDITTQRTLYTQFEPHAEFMHWFNLGNTTANGLFRRCISRNCYWPTSNTNLNTIAKDLIFADVIFENGNVGTGASASFGGTSHVCWIGCMFDSEVTNYGGGDAYCKAINCITRGVFNTGSWPARASFEHDFILPGWQGMPAGANDTDLHSIADLTAWAALFTDVANGNYAPAGVLASTTVPKQTAYDALFNLRAANDAIGPIAIGAAAPSYPT